MNAHLDLYLDLLEAEARDPNCSEERLKAYSLEISRILEAQCSRT